MHLWYVYTCAPLIWPRKKWVNHIYFAFFIYKHHVNRAFYYIIIVMYMQSCYANRNCTYGWPLSSYINDTSIFSRVSISCRFIVKHCICCVNNVCSSSSLSTSTQKDYPLIELNSKLVGFKPYNSCHTHIYGKYM